MIKKSRGLKKMLVWYLLLNKRLVKKTGFIVILCLIPLLAFLMTSVTKSEDSGLLRVALYKGNDPTPEALELLSGFENSESDVFRFYDCESEEEALEMLNTSRVESAWVFADDLMAQIKRYAKGNSVTLVNIYESESGAVMKLSHEKIFSVLYPEISYALYDAYIDDALESGKEIPEEERREIYDSIENKDSLMEYEYLNSSKEQIIKSNYLTTPMGGMFAVLMLLCGLASTMYFLSDEKKGTFTWLGRGKRALVMWISNFSAVTFAAIFSTAALIFSDNYTTLANETLFMLLYILALSSFCTLVGTLIPSERAFGIIIPILLVVCLVFCPIFLDLKGLGAIRMLLPTSYFLYGRLDGSYLLPFVIYTSAVTLVAFLIYGMKGKFNRNF